MAVSAITCGLPPEIDYAYLSAVPSLNTGDSVTYEAYPGFSFAADATLQCDASTGDWSSTQPSVSGEVKCVSSTGNQYYSADINVWI